MRLHPFTETNRKGLAAAIPGFRSYVAGSMPHTLSRSDHLHTYEADSLKAGWLRALADGEAAEDVTCGTAATCQKGPE